ncbi:histidine phosphatase family protein [Caulobacter sp. 17J65-9]|uniref:histidine phosphatase family protein n=1 Tax=Caulobacter sp. 17J65-9 TaxID=2709382 RepID=UPI0013CA1CE0|nr:histidine phosphatase family protein [Caulobacter sp. 17J65-9]
MTATVLLVRHASHDRLGRVLCGRMAGVILSDQGRREAQALGRRLADRELAAVYSSPLERTRETAEALAAPHGLTPELDPDLNEVDVGDWAGRAFDDLAGPEWDRWNQARSGARAPGGEAMTEVQARVARALARLRDRHPGQTVAVVSHGDVIKAAVATALQLSLDGLQRFDIAPASVSTLVVGDWGMKVHDLNGVCA